MTNLQLFEIKNLKRNLDAKIMNMVKEFEHKTCLEVVGIYVERIDASEMGSERKSILTGVEVQAVLEPVLPEATQEVIPEGGKE
jgi:hypothetical protein